MDDVRAQLCDFLAELSEGRMPPGAWERYAVAHYLDEGLEAVRRELVAASLQSDLTSPEFRTKSRALRERLLGVQHRSDRVR